MCARFVYDKCLTDKKIITVDTKAEIKTLTLNVVGKYVDTDKVNIGIPRYESECIPVIYNTKIAKNLKIEILDKRFDVNCVLNGLTSCNVKVKLLGGNLDILYNDNNHVYDWPL